MVIKPHLGPHAAHHLHYGFVQRLFMLQAGRMHLLEDANPHDSTTRGVFVATELSLQANAYYLNLRGSLDNLAWCLQYELRLIPSTTERHGRRTDVYLFGERFLIALDKADPKLALALRDASSWAEDLSNRRDPAAHRIPLHVPRTVFDEDDLRKFNEVHAAATVLMRTGNHRKGMELLYTLEQLGRFEPILIQSDAEHITPVPLHPQIASDHDAFLHVCEVVLKALGSRGMAI